MKLTGNICYTIRLVQPFFSVLFLSPRKEHAMKVKDIMSPVTEYLIPEETLQQAVVKMRTTKRLNNLGVKGLVVLNDRKDLVGILTIKDILRATIPVYLDIGLAKFSWDGMLEEMAKRVACKSVGDYMSTDVLTVSEDASLMTCADLMIKKNMQRLPVVNGENRAVGIVYIRDIFNVVSQIFVEQSGCKI